MLIVLTNLWGMYTNFRLPALRIQVLFFTKEVQKLNQKCKQKKQAEKEQHISDVSPEKHLGYFSFKNINDSLGCKRFIDLMQTATNFRFNIFDMMSALIYARTVHPCSKSKKLMMRLSQISLKTTIFHWTSCIPVWSTLAPNTKR